MFDVIVGVTATYSAGKDMVADFFVEKGFHRYSHSDEIRDELKRRGVDVENLKSRDPLIEVGNELRRKGGNDVLSRMILAKLKAPAVVVSIRHPDEVRAYREAFGKRFVLVGIDAPRELRYERSRRRAREGGGDETFDEFVVREERELHGTGETQRLAETMAMADVTIMNDSTIPALHQELENLYNKWQSIYNKGETDG